MCPLTKLEVTMPRKKGVPPSFRSFSGGLGLRRACTGIDGTEIIKKFLHEPTGEIWEFDKEIDSEHARFKTGKIDPETGKRVIRIFNYKNLGRG
jgi:hypothetical protein